MTDVIVVKLNKLANLRPEPYETAAGLSKCEINIGCKVCAVSWIADFAAALAEQAKVSFSKPTWFAM